MHIVADENIPLLEEFFGDIGSITRVPGRTLSRADLEAADILLVRSITRVDRSLLEGTPVKFVGTATIGTDHVDTHWLAGQGIAFAAAPGCNADAVVEYVISCLVLLGERSGASLTRPTVGIVGCGNVGGRLRSRLERLGFQVSACDPPLEAEGQSGFVSLDEALSCDVISLHTPLTRDGPYPSYHLLDRERLARLKGHQLLINSGRGAVVDNQALLARLDAEDPPLAILDVWEDEPLFSAALLEKVWLGTPHIAGYSLEGKINGTGMVYQALCRHLGLPTRKQAGQFMPGPPLSKLTFTDEAEREQAVGLSVKAIYDPRIDDFKLRQTLSLADGERAEAFDRLRKTYRVRREFSSVKIHLKGAAHELQHSFKALGFKLKS